MSKRIFANNFILWSYPYLFKTSGFWPRVRARALRAPAFFSSLPPPNGALRTPPPHPLQLSCFLFDPKKYIKSIQPGPPTSRTFFFPPYRRGYEVPCPPSRPSQLCWFFRQYFRVKSIYRCDHTHYFFPVFLFFSFWIFFFCVSLLFLLSFSISSYSSLLISSYSSRRAILRLLILLLLYFKLFIVLQTCILIIYVHISIILRGFSKGPNFFYLLILLYCTALYSSCLLYYRHAYETHTEYRYIIHGKINSI